MLSRSHQRLTRGAQLIAERDFYSIPTDSPNCAADEPEGRAALQSGEQKHDSANQRDGRPLGSTASPPRQNKNPAKRQNRMRALLLAPGQLGGPQLCEFQPLSVSSGAADGRRRSPSAAATKNTWQKKQTNRQNNPDSRGGETDDTKTTAGLSVCSAARLVVLFDISSF